MISPTDSLHDSTIRTWTQSAEHNRIRLYQMGEHNPHGKYHVRMKGSSRWISCDSPPVDGASEWLFVNLAGTPLFYWSSVKNTVMLIG